MSLQPLTFEKRTWVRANHSRSENGRDVDLFKGTAAVGSPLLVALEESMMLASRGELRRSLDLAFAEIDRALRAEKFEMVDRALRHFDFEHADLDLAVTTLMTCKPARDRLPSRPSAVERLRLRVETQHPERAAAILRYI
ncbi:MAG: hypothetical protein IT378_21580 [Sandaracinaceae bacterium]|nr:hypothetical protein [Sandaracinaceae bacterium]